MSDDSLIHLKEKINKMQQTMDRLAVLSINNKRIAGIMAMLAAVALFGWVGLGAATNYVLAPLFVVFSILAVLLNKDAWVVLTNGAIFLAFIFLVVPVDPPARYGIYIMSVCTLAGALAGIGHFQRQYQAASTQLNIDRARIKRLQDLNDLRRHLVMLERGADEMEGFAKLLRHTELNLDIRERVAGKLETWSSELTHLVSLEDVMAQIIEQKRLVEASMREADVNRP